MNKWRSIGMCKILSLNVSKKILSVQVFLTQLVHLHFLFDCLRLASLHHQLARLRRFFCFAFAVLFLVFFGLFLSVFYDLFVFAFFVHFFDIPILLVTSTYIWNVTGGVSISSPAILTSRSSTLFSISLSR